VIEFLLLPVALNQHKSEGDQQQSHDANDNVQIFLA